MALANTLAYYDTAIIKTVKSFTVQDHRFLKLHFAIKTYKLISNGTAHFKNVSNCLYTNVYSYFETSGVIRCNPNLNVVHFFNTNVN